jgi:hypothetical protein
MPSKQRKVLAILNAIAFVAVVALNYLSNIQPLGGLTIGEVSEKYDNLFTPAGFTFAIWGIIYLLLGIFTVFQIVRAFDSEETNGSFIDRIGIWFFVSSIANIAWLAAWQLEVLWLSVILMLFLLGSLLLVYVRLGIGSPVDSRRVRALVHVPFSVYLGWISVATIANISAFLTAQEWNAFNVSEIFWTALLITIAILLGMRMLFGRRDIFYSAVIAWASFGIYSALQTENVGVLPWVAVAGIIIISIGMVWVLVRGRAYVQMERQVVT